MYDSPEPKGSPHIHRGRNRGEPDDRQIAEAYGRLSFPAMSRVQCNLTSMQGCE